MKKKSKKKRAAKSKSPAIQDSRPKIGGGGIEPGALLKRKPRGRKRVMSSADHTMESLSQQFCKLMSEADMTAAQLGRLTNIAPESILKIDSHAKVPPLQTLVPLLDALGAEIVIRKKSARKS